MYSGVESEFLVSHRYIAYTDGGVRGGNPGVAGWGFYLLDTQERVTEHGRGILPGAQTNNFAEYAAVYHLLSYAKSKNISSIDINCDSQLVVKQLNGVWDVKFDAMRWIFSATLSMLSELDSKIQWIPRSQNKLADRLVEEMLDKHTGRTRNGKKVVNN